MYQSKEINILRNSLEEITLRINKEHCISVYNPNFEAFDNVREALGIATEALDNFEKLLGYTKGTDPRADLKFTGINDKQYKTSLKNLDSIIKNGMEFR